MKKYLSYLAFLAVLLTAWLSCPFPARAVVLDAPAGTLVTAQALTGVSTNSVIADGSAALYFEVTMTATASVQLRQIIPGGTVLLNVLGTGMPATSNSIFKIDNPSGVYDASSTITSGTVTVKYSTVNVR